MKKFGNTNIKTEQGITIVTLHGTDIVKFGQVDIILNSGGYKTVTTKRRMNQISDMFDLEFIVYQENYKWFVDFKGEILEFADGMLVER